MPAKRSAMPMPMSLSNASWIGTAWLARTARAYVTMSGVVNHGADTGSSVVCTGRSIGVHESPG